jgi:hypothetical protein
MGKPVPVVSGYRVEVRGRRARGRALPSGERLPLPGRAAIERGLQVLRRGSRLPGTVLRHARPNMCCAAASTPSGRRIWNMTRSASRCSNASYAGAELTTGGKPTTPRLSRTALAARRIMRGCCPRPADRLKPPKGRDRVAETPLRQASREPLVGLAGRPLKAALRRLCAYLCGRAGHSSPPCARPAVRSAVARWSTARNCGWEAADEARYDARGRTKCLTHQPTRTSFRNQCRRASRS